MYKPEANCYRAVVVTISDSAVRRSIHSYVRQLKEIADKDYITARMCYLNDLLENFFWNSQQCIEKYLKAIGLLYQIDIRKHGHDIKPLFNKINKTIKFGCIDHYWPQYDEGIIKFDETFLSFLDRLTKLGINRYASYSWFSYGDEIVKLDAAVAIIRRYCIPKGRSSRNPEKPIEEKIKAAIDSGNDFTHTTNSFFQSKMKEDKLGRFLRESNIYLNDLDSREIIMCSASNNNVLSRSYEQSKKGSCKQKLSFIKLSEFLLDHIYMPNEFKSEMEKLVRMTYKELCLDQQCFSCSCYR